MRHVLQSVSVFGVCNMKPCLSKKSTVRRMASRKYCLVLSLSTSENKSLPVALPISVPPLPLSLWTDKGQIV